MPRGDQQKKVWAKMNPKKRATRLTAIERACSTPEVREKRSASHKKRWAVREKVKAERMDAVVERAEAEEMPRAELMRVQPQTGVPDLATLDLLIQKRVAEAQVSQGLILEPWFQPAIVADELRRRLSAFHRHKFAIYFELHGCLVCQKKTGAHEGHGMCNKCYVKVFQRLKAIERQYAEAHPQEYVDQQIDRISRRVSSSSAERILGMKPEGRS